jgi:hypothetical protein
MKFSLLIASLLASQSAAFTANLPASVFTTSTTSTSLNLFGNGGDKGGEKKPGMMDQLGMFKKAQEMATKKAKLDEELTKMNFEGLGADGKVKASFKYVPISNPMDPNPDYEAVKFDFDDAFFESATPEELSEAVKECVLSGIENTNVAVAEKYAVLQSDLMAAFGGAAGGQAIEGGQ